MSEIDPSPTNRSRAAWVSAWVTAFTCCTCAVAAQTRPVDALPSPEELRQTFVDERYHDVIRSIAAILPLRGEAVAAYDRHELLVLKAESHLRLGDHHLAAKTFDEASEIAEEGIDAATDRATAVLIRRARRDGYTARSGPTAGETLPIVEADGRRLALKALYHDEREAKAKRLSSAPQARDVAELLAGLELVLHVRDFELAASGGDLDAQSAMAPLANRAEQMIEDQVETLSSRAEKLDKSAHSKKKMGSHYRKRGLAKEEVVELRRYADDCRRLAVAAQRFADAVSPSESPLQPAASSRSDEFIELRREAEQLVRRIEATLTADYGGVHEKN